MRYGEEKLWLAVIERAMSDITDKQLSIYERMEVFDWIYDGGLDFELVCDLANVSPNAVRKKLLEKKVRKSKKIIS
jgi:hypothetical protein